MPPVYRVRVRLLTAAWATIGPVVGGCAHHDRPPAAPLRADAFASPRSLPGLPNFAAVAPGLYRGAQPTAEGFRQLERLGVRTVVNLRSMHDDRELLVGTTLRYVRIPCSAWGVDRQHLRQFLAVVNDPANQPIFVHCQHGADRTGFMVAAYRVLRQGWDCGSAVAELHTFGFHRIWGYIPVRLRALGAGTARVAS